MKSHPSWTIYDFYVGILPTYSRAISDPVPGGVELLESHKVVIVEGNYMLNYDDPLWAPLKDLFDIKVLLSFDRITENSLLFFV